MVKWWMVHTVQVAKSVILESILTIRPHVAVDLEGCLETECSIRGINRMAKVLIQSKKYKTTLTDDESLSPKQIFQAAKDGDAVGLKVADQVGYYLGLACAGIAVNNRSKSHINWWRYFQCRRYLIRKH